jgi:hypothetical protein
MKVYLELDNLPRFTSRIFQAWLHKQVNNWVKIHNGKSQQNVIVKRYICTYRDDILDAKSFFSLEYAMQNIQDYRIFVE